MKQVLWIMGALQAGGAARMTLDITGALARDYAVTLLLVKRGMLQEFPGNGAVRVAALLPNEVRIRDHLPYVLRQLYQRIREHDLVVASVELETTYLTTIAAKVVGRPCIAICHTPLSGWIRANGLSALHQHVSRFIYRLADRIVAVSDTVARDLRANFGVAEEHVRVIHSPIDWSRLRRLALETPEWSPPREMVLGLGRLSREKGFDLLIRAVAELPGHLKPRLVILGEGPQRDELQALANLLGLRDRFYLPGFLSNPYPLLREAQVFVFPSRHEGSPIALVEAMAFGLPVIATRIPAIEEICGSYRCAMLATPEDSRDLSEKLAQLLSEEELRTSLSGRALVRARAYDIGPITESWQSLLNEMCP